MAEVFAYLDGFGIGGGFTKSIIIVTDLPTGSTVTATKGETVKTADEKNGEWWFKNLDIGEWTLKAVLGDQSATTVYNIEQFGVYYVSMSYQLYPDDFDWSEMGTKGVDYEIVQDDDTPIPVGDYRKYKNWKARVLTSGFVTALKDGYIDVFAVGGGGAGFWAGGGSGYTNTQRVEIKKSTRYNIIIGAGGEIRKTGGQTSAFGVAANGGKSPTSEQGWIGGAGGSGGGSGYDYGETPNASDMNGGTDGSDGSGEYKGKGQGTTTREFGEQSGRLYAAGGAGAGEKRAGTGGEPGGGNGSVDNNGKPGEKNTGSGGGGTFSDSKSGGVGGSGIIVFRNSREVS